MALTSATSFSGRSATRITVAGALILAALTGCSGGSVEVFSHREPPVSSSGHAGPALVAPFHGLTTMSPLESAQLQHAQNILTADCMKKRSFNFTVPGVPMPVDGSEPESPYALISATTAATQGYGISNNYEVNKRDAQIAMETQPQADRPGFMAALAGTSAHAESLTVPGGGRISFDANGCVAMAIGELYGVSWTRVYYTLGALSFAIVSKVEDSTAWKRAVRAWSSCVLKQYGSRFVDLAAIRTAVYNTVASKVTKLSGASLHEALSGLRVAEIRLAVTDARCEASVDLGTVARGLQSLVELGYEKRYAADIAVYSSDLQTALRKAACTSSAAACDPSLP